MFRIRISRKKGSGQRYKKQTQETETEKMTKKNKFSYPPHNVNYETFAKKINFSKHIHCLKHRQIYARRDKYIENQINKKYKDEYKEKVQNAIKVNPVTDRLSELLTETY